LIDLQAEIGNYKISVAHMRTWIRVTVEDIEGPSIKKVTLEGSEKV